MTTENTLLTDYLPGDVRGKSVIVTGGTAGIGRAIGILLAKMGADVLIVGTNEGHLQDALSSVDGQLEGKLDGIVADVSTEEGVQKIFAEADQRFDKLDIFINNAALAFKGAAEGTFTDWQKVVTTNLLGYIACAHHAIERMKSNKKGHIVNIGSMSADVREKDSSVYTATKSGIQGFSESLRKEVNELGIKVTLIEPGMVGSDMQDTTSEEEEKMQGELTILKAEDIAASVYFALIQPERCDIVDIKVRPHLQVI